jgi:replication protein O
MGKPEQNLLLVNSTQVPNVFLDRIMCVATDAIFKCLMCVARQTYGWRKHWDAISITQIERITGLSNRSVIDNMAHLREAGLVLRRTGENPKYGMEYSLNLNGDIDKSITYLQSLRKEREKREKPSGGRKQSKNSHEPGSSSAVNTMHPHEPLAGGKGFMGSYEPGSPPAMNEVHTQKPTIKTNYQNQGGEKPAPAQMALTPSVALIAQQRFMDRIGDRWQKAEAEASEPNQARNLFITVRMSAKQAGLDYAIAKVFLADHPGWFDWPYLKDLDSQREINFPEPEQRSVSDQTRELHAKETGKTQQRQDRSIESIRTAVSRMAGQPDGVREGEVPESGIDPRNSAGVPRGLGANDKSVRSG